MQGIRQTMELTVGSSKRVQCSCYQSQAGGEKGEREREEEKQVFCSTTSKR